MYYYNYKKEKSEAGREASLAGIKAFIYRIVGFEPQCAPYVMNAYLKWMMVFGAAPGWIIYLVLLIMRGSILFGMIFFYIAIYIIDIAVSI